MKIPYNVKWYTEHLMGQAFYNRLQEQLLIGGGTHVELSNSRKLVSINEYLNRKGVKDKGKYKTVEDVKAAGLARYDKNGNFVPLKDEKGFYKLSPKWTQLSDQAQAHHLQTLIADTREGLRKVMLTGVEKKGKKYATPETFYKFDPDIFYHGMDLTTYGKEVQSREAEKSDVDKATQDLINGNTITPEQKEIINQLKQSSEDIDVKIKKKTEQDDYEVPKEGIPQYE